MTAVHYRPRAQIELDRASIFFPLNPQKSLDRSHNKLGNSLLPKSSLESMTPFAFVVLAFTVSAPRQFTLISSIAAMTFPVPGETVCHRGRETGGDDIVVATRRLSRLEVVPVSIYALLLPHPPNLEESSEHELPVSCKVSKSVVLCWDTVDVSHEQMSVLKSSGVMTMSSKTLWLLQSC